MNAMSPYPIPEAAIDVLEPGARRRPRRDALRMEKIEFSPASLESYAFAQWGPVLHDAMTVAAAAEYADRMTRRPARGWTRRFQIRIPVYDLPRWVAPETTAALVGALELLTGDRWVFEFVQRRAAFTSPELSQFDFGPETRAVIAYSDGMDSRAVAGLVGKELNGKLVKIRLGTKAPRRRPGQPFVTPFAGIPYKLDVAGDNRESSARNRGFKFASISGIAAYLAGASEVIIPESGQGALGPSLVGVAHGYPDYRNHPLFAAAMERYFKILFEREIRFRFPRLWYTKGQTLEAYVSTVRSTDWADTRSCWQGSRTVSVAGKRRQCGVCAACMLRRLSVHAAGLEEPPETYVAEDLSASRLADAVNPSFGGLTQKFANYADAGFLHLDHLADMASAPSRRQVSVYAARLAPTLSLSVAEAEQSLLALLEQHQTEWEAFMSSLGNRSFLASRFRAVR